MFNIVHLLINKVYITYGKIAGNLFQEPLLYNHVTAIRKINQHDNIKKDYIRFSIY
jgi:hypothetical protein